MITNQTTALSRNARITVLVVAFLGWFCAGLDMSITQLAGRPAAIDLLSESGRIDKERYQALTKLSVAKGSTLIDADKAQLTQWDNLIGQWFAWYQCAFLFGAATGGLVFGWFGDRFGRSKGMSVSILTYSTLGGAAYFAQTPEQLLVLWYLACTGVGGMWPNGVALVSEAWSGLSRPMIAGVIGTSANVGIFLFATIANAVAITADSWRWVMLVGSPPMLLGVVALFFVSESPRWLAARREQMATPVQTTPIGEVFRRPLLGITVLGIVLATTPLIGGWGTANWMNPWADKAGNAADPPNPSLKAEILQARSVTGIVGSLLGGWIASYLGRRRTYFLVSLASLLIAQYIFWFLYPTDASFLFWAAALGFVSGVYFGWLPLFLPELFPTRVRSTGSGVSFNFGRIITASTIFAFGLMMALFEGDFARIGRVTSLLFIVGMVAIWFAPDTSGNNLDEPVAKPAKSTIVDD